MGSALAGTLLDAGRSVTVWNRTPDRCAPLVERGARLAASIEDAIESADVVLVCVLEYAASREIFAGDAVATAMKGTSLVQFSSGSSDDARHDARWAEENGAQYLEGAIFAYPRAVGTPDCSMIYSGSEPVFESARPILESLGKARYMGSDASLVNILNFSAGSFYEVALGAFVEAAAYAAAEGATPADLLSVLPEALGVVSDSIEFSARQMMRGDFSGEEATIDVHADAVRAIADKMAAVGSANKFAVALLEYLEEAQKAGAGGLEFAAIYNLATAPDPA
jgi:3-hydroxyisobutyrate dehydrogenase-like beta-hydroxyacid dehydrogenase